LGEILGLQKDAIVEDRLMIVHSYSKKEGLKTPKNGKPRVLHLPEILKSELISLARTNPHGEPWIFWSEKSGVPINVRTVEKAFYTQLEKIGIGDESIDAGTTTRKRGRQSRHISFHSFRHLYNTLLRGAIPDEMLRASTGHLSVAMTDRYDHSDHDQRLKETAKAVNSRIMPFLIAEGNKS
jgi:integrase